MIYQQFIIKTTAEMLMALNEKKRVGELLDTFGKHAVLTEEVDFVASQLFRHKRYALALPYAERLVEMTDQNPSALMNYANVLSHTCYPEKALEILDSINPRTTEIELMRAYALFQVGQLKEAQVILEREYANPALDEKTRREINFNLGTYDLYDGHFHRGLSRFLKNGRKLGLWKTPEFHFREWDGSLDSVDHIVIKAEGGIGDEILNVRFGFRLAKEKRVTWITTRKDVADLLTEQADTPSFRATTYQSDVEVDSRTAWCNSMDLPLLMKIEPDDLWTGPYIKNIYSNPEPHFGRRVGIRWQGNPDYDDDLHRSVPFEHLISCINPLATLVCLQRDTGLEEMKGFHHTRYITHPSLATWQDTICAIDSCDEVVTSCTSVAHMAAAMGKKTTIFVPLSAYYPWCNPNPDISPWYGPNLRLIRQTSPRTWPSASL